MRRTTAQQYFRQKMSVLQPIQSSDNQGNVRVTFSLQNTGNGATVGGFDKTQRWLQTYRNYESYAVKGLKLKWIPTNARGGISQNVSGDLIDGTGSIQSQIHQSQLGNQTLYFDPDTYDTISYTYNEVMVLDRNWCFDPTRTWKKYFSAKRLSQMQQCKWQDCATYNPGVRNELTQASIGFIQPYSGQGQGANTTYGYIKATWYVTFRGQAYNQ